MATGPELAALEARLPGADAREEALYARLAALGVAWKAYSHPPVFTVEESKVLRGTVPGGHTKNLFLEDRKSGLWLVVAREDQRIDLNALAKALGAPRFSFGSGELLVATFGVPPGSVTPFALMNAGPGVITTLVEASLMQAATLNFHPLRNDRTISVSPDGLLTFLRACGHEPRILALPAKAS
ncbi:MAG: prolyl-tRNA synthetase associated domain-containing protein [Alphaproteobacteria bacterium]